jgi:hypothetical protein
MSDDEGEKRFESRKFEWRDYVALIIAMFETTLLPIVIAVIFLVLLVLVLK